MTEEEDGRNDERGDDLATLFGRVAARERPRAAAEAAAFATLHAEWQSRMATRRRRRSAAFGAAAAASLVAATLGYAWLQAPGSSAPAMLAAIEHVEGDNVTWRDDRSQAQPLGARRGFTEGERLATGADARVALRWHDGGSLRLDADSRLELVSAAAVRLTAGSLYFDSTAGSGTGNRRPALAVQTPAGEVVHVGTQFMVTVASDEVVLSVREGQVKVTGDGFELVVDTNEALGLRSDGTREMTAIDGHGERWAWAANVAPQIELDGRTTFDVVSWAARETGRRVVYTTAAAQARARDEVLRGIDRRSPDGILELLPHLTGLAYEIRGATIVVSEP
jgi:ferric-dicitrate binding protein FerR (iron transport regulator)